MVASSFEPIGHLVAKCGDRQPAEDGRNGLGRHGIDGGERGSGRLVRSLPSPIGSTFNEPATEADRGPRDRAECVPTRTRRSNAPCRHHRHRARPEGRRHRVCSRATDGARRSHHPLVRDVCDSLSPAVPRDRAIAGDNPEVAGASASLRPRNEGQAGRWWRPDRGRWRLGRVHQTARRWRPAKRLRQARP